MEHADVRAWLDDAFFQPGVLRQLSEGYASGRLDDGAPAVADPQLDALLEHLEGCSDCVAYAASLRSAGLALDVALGPSPAMKERTLTAVRSVGRRRGPAESTRPVSGVQPGVSAWRTLGSLRLAAAFLVVAVLGAAIGAALATAARPDSLANERLSRAVSMMSELARDPATKQVVLLDVAGESAGVAFVSGPSERLAIFSASLAASDGEEYWCYLERGSAMTELGPMHEVDDVYFWAGPIDVTDVGLAGDRLVVATDEDADPALWGGF